MAGKETLKALWKALVNTKGFTRVAEKVELISAENGNCQAEFVVSEEMTNFAGTLHGGLTASLIDIISTMGLTTSKKNVPGASVNMSINYLKPAVVGDEILIFSKARKVGKTLAFLDVELVKKQTGDLIATGTHVKYIGG